MTVQGNEWRAAYAKLDEAVHELHRLMECANEIPAKRRAMPTDYVLVVGSMYLDSDSGRCGVVTYFPKDGTQPSYITIGLLTSTAQAIAAQQIRD
jgi:hypothetical protein